MQLGIGGTLVGLAAHQFHQDEDSCSPTCAPSSWHGWQTRATVGDVLLVTGGATVTAGLVWWLVHPHVHHDAAVGFVPAPGGSALWARSDAARPAWPR